MKKVLIFRSKIIDFKVLSYEILLKHLPSGFPLNISSPHIFLKKFKKKGIFFVKKKIAL